MLNGDRPARRHDLRRELRFPRKSSHQQRQRHVHVSKRPAQPIPFIAWRRSVTLIAIGDLDAFVIGVYPELWRNNGAGVFTITTLPDSPYSSPTWAWAISTTTARSTSLPPAGLFGEQFTDRGMDLVQRRGGQLHPGPADGWLRAAAAPGPSRTSTMTATWMSGSSAPPAINSG
jgi:hypothetical protein